MRRQERREGSCHDGGARSFCTDVTVLAVTLGVILQDVTTEGTWVTDTRDHFLHCVGSYNHLKVKKFN